MTMHLMGPQYTTNNNRKRKKPMTQRKQQQLQSDWKSHNRWLKRHGRPSVSFSEYLDEISGKKFKQTQFVPLKQNNTYRRGTTDHIPSRGDSIGVAPRSESPQYTGDEIVGIATLHKSNAVPVRRGTDEAKDISRMRRG